MLQACKRGGVEIWRSGAREACCGRGDVEVFASLPQELGRSGGMLRALIYKRSGDALQACCLYLPQEPRSSSGALLALPLFASRALELRRHAVGVLPLRDMETGRKRADVVT